MDFNMWLRACEAANELPYPLDVVDRGTGLYMTQKTYIADHREFHTSPVFHVWINGQTWETTMSETEAWRMWENRG